MKIETLGIDNLINVVNNGGLVKTGVDVLDESGVLLLGKEVLLGDVAVLLNIKNNGVLDVPINPDNAGGLWDKFGNRISLGPDQATVKNGRKESNVEIKLQEITELKHEAAVKYKMAKGNIKKVLTDIKKSGGQFDFEVVENTVTDLFSFIAKNDSAFTYLTKEIFSYDDYLYNHAINVCTIGTAVLKKFNEGFGAAINKYLSSLDVDPLEDAVSGPNVPFMYYLPEELHDMAYGFFLHDIGKVLIPEKILNKKAPLTRDEFALAKTHSFEKGVDILAKNRLHNAFIKNITKYHHSALFTDELNCYPIDKLPFEIPLYVKICKLVDIYDAMSSKRSYKDALNPVGVVTEIFHKYAKKDRMLQFILYSFVKVVGIYPPSSIVFLQNGQMAYVIDSDGPIVIPFADVDGVALTPINDPIDLAVKGGISPGLNIDRRRPLVSPVEAYDILPSFLKESAQLEKNI